MPRNINSTFEVGKRYVRVYMQQGRVETDTDFNEKAETSKKLFSRIRKSIDSFERSLPDSMSNSESLDQILLKTGERIGESLYTYQEKIGNESYIIDTKSGRVYFGDGKKGKRIPQGNTVGIKYAKETGKTDRT